MGGSRMGTGYGSADLCGDLAVYRTPAGIRSHGGDAKVCSGRRRDRGLDHLHGDPQHGGSGAGPNSLLIVVAQIIVAYLIELFGLFGVEKAPFAWNKLLGAAIAVGGIIIFQR